MSDDWGWDVPDNDWYDNTNYEWRSSLIKADTVPVIEVTDEGIDITGASQAWPACSSMCSMHKQAHEAAERVSASVSQWPFTECSTTECGLCSSRQWRKALDIAVPGPSGAARCCKACTYLRCLHCTAPGLLQGDRGWHAGVPAGSGQPLDRPPWDMWKSLRQAVITRELTSSFEPFAFLAHTVSNRVATTFLCCLMLASLALGTAISTGRGKATGTGLQYGARHVCVPKSASEYLPCASSA